jgi:hypothetical protein
MTDTTPRRSRRLAWTSGVALLALVAAGGAFGLLPREAAQAKVQ